MNHGLEPLSFRDCIYSKNSLYFFSSEDSFPMKKNLVTGEIKVLPLHFEGNWKEGDLDLEISIGRNLYALEREGEYLIKYDLDTYDVSHYEIDCSYRLDGNFAYLGALNDSIFIFTREAGKLVVFDTCKKIEKSVMYPSERNDIYICGCRMENRFFIFPQNGNRVLEYDVCENIWRVHRIQENLKKCMHVTINEDKIYILLADGTVFEWNVKREEWRRVEYDLQIYSDQNAASRICCIKDQIIILPSTGEDIIMFGLNDRKVHVYHDYPKDFMYDEKKKNWNKYYGYCETQEYYYFANRVSNYMLAIDKEKMKLDWIKSEVSTEQKFTWLMNRGDILWEREKMLELFVKYNKKEKKIHNGELCGRKIWENIAKS